VDREKAGECFKVTPGGGAFVTTEGVKVGGGEGGAAVMFKRGVDVGAVSIGSIGGEALEDAAGVGDFGIDEGGCDGEGEAGIEGALVMGDAVGRATVGRKGVAEDTTGVSAAETNGNFAAKQFAEGRDGDVRVFFDKSPFNFVKGNCSDSRSGFVVSVGNFDAKVFADKGGFGSGRAEIKRGHGNVWFGMVWVDFIGGECVGEMARVLRCFR
jgi:hypothetical protein